MNSDALKKLKTLRRIHIPGAIYFVTASTHRKATVLRERSAHAVSAALQRLRAESRADVLAYVVMPDHLHALLVPRGGDQIGKVVAFIKHVSSKSVRRGGFAGRVWEERFYDRVLRNEDELRNAVAYIHANPVRAGLCEDERAWPWSTEHTSVPSNLTRVFARWNTAAASRSNWRPDDSEG
ncbi:MAG: transposase [Actinobacteria bacterium]|nr:transposase [Actinomycetota bacterium]